MESTEQTQIILDAVKNPKKYKGCDLCFGRGYIRGYEDTKESICPKCEGHGIIKEYEMLSKKCPKCKENLPVGIAIATKDLYPSQEDYIKACGCTK